MVAEASDLQLLNAEPTLYFSNRFSLILCNSVLNGVISFLLQMKAVPG